MARKSLPWFPWYRDRVGTSPVIAAMTGDEYRSWSLLLMQAWEQSPPGSLPTNDDVLAVWAGVTPDRWSEMRQRVLAAFKLGSDGRYHDLIMGLRDSFARSSREYQSKADAGRKGGQATQKKWREERGKSSTAQAQLQAEVKQDQANTLVSDSSLSISASSCLTERESVLGEKKQKPFRSLPKPVVDQGVNPMEGFDRFWAEYPNKAHEKGARQEWANLAPDRHLRAEIMEALGRQKCSRKWINSGGVYIPNPGNWLRDQRWKDTPPIPMSEEQQAKAEIEEAYQGMMAQLKREVVNGDVHT